MKRRSVILIGLLLIGGAFGRVFRAREVPYGQLNTVGLGWQAAYQTTMNVNGVHNDLYVFAVDANYPVADQIQAQFKDQGADVLLKESPDGYRGVAKFDDREARILVLSGVAKPNHLVFLFYPDPSKSSGHPRMPIPEFPGAVSDQLVTNDKTGTICRTLTTETDSAQVMAYYATTLSATGWSTVLPSRARATQMAMFQKGEQICTVMAENRPDELNRVTVLVKGGTF